MTYGAPAYLASFGRRGGRKLKATKQSLVDTLLPNIHIAVPEAGKKLSPSELLPQKILWLEIGFGGGEHLAAQAARHPDIGFIGCEPYWNGIASGLNHIQKNDLKNVRIFTEDARLLLDALPDACVERIFILFPDPWRKVRHHKRRLVSLPTLEIICRVLKAGGMLRLATDHVDYSAWMLEQTLACQGLTWQATHKQDWKQPPADWVQTRYEMKARAAGRPPVYYDFIRNP